MDKLYKFIENNAEISNLDKDFDSEEWINYYQADIYVKFNNKNYYSKISYPYNSTNYKIDLINKLRNKIIFDLGLQSLEKIFNKSI